MAPEDRERAVLELVCGQAAVVLGHPDMDRIGAGQAFKDLGFDSLTAVEFRNHLTKITGLRLPATLIFDYPTPASLVDQLREQLSADRVASPSQYTLASLYETMSANGQVFAATQMLIAASWSLPTFAIGDSPAHAIRPVALATGPIRPKLVCVPAVAPAATPHEYDGLGRKLDGSLDTAVIPYPGFGAGQAVPDDRATLIAMHARTVVEHISGEPYVLLGRSMGGAVAHALTSELERLGNGPLGLVMIDTYQVEGDNRIEDWLLGLPARTAMADGPAEDALLIAMAAYMRIFANWTPSPIATPTLFLRALSPVPEMNDVVDWHAGWQLPHELVDIAGDHFTVLTEHSDSTAAAVLAWIEMLD
jgi:thioesterase domain-containing protein/acyl carrier protein